MFFLLPLFYECPMQIQLTDGHETATPIIFLQYEDCRNDEPPINGIYDHRISLVILCSSSF